MSLVVRSVRAMRRTGSTASPVGQNLALSAVVIGLFVALAIGGCGSPIDRPSVVRRLQGATAMREREAHAGSESSGRRPSGAPGILSFDCPRRSAERGQAVGYAAVRQAQR